MHLKVTTRVLIVKHTDFPAMESGLYLEYNRELCDSDLFFRKIILTALWRRGWIACWIYIPFRQVKQRLGLARCSGKESACQCRRHRRHRFDPRVGKIPWRRKWQPTPVFLPGKSHGQRSLVGYSPRGHKESSVAERTHTYARTHRLQWDTDHYKQLPQINTQLSNKEFATMPWHNCVLKQSSMLVRGLWDSLNSLRVSQQHLSTVIWHQSHNLNGELCWRIVLQTLEIPNYSFKM